MQRRSEYRVEGISQIEGIPVATIAIEDTLSLSPAEEEVPAGISVDTRMKTAESQGTVLFDLDRAEAVGRHHRERTVVERRLTMPGQSMTQTIEDLRLSQILRIQEASP